MSPSELSVNHRYITGGGEAMKDGGGELSYGQQKQPMFPAEPGWCQIASVSVIRYHAMIDRAGCQVGRGGNHRLALFRRALQADDRDVGDGATLTLSPRHPGGDHVTISPAQHDGYSAQGDTGGGWPDGVQALNQFTAPKRTDDFSPGSGQPAPGPAIHHERHILRHVRPESRSPVLPRRTCRPPHSVRRCGATVRPRSS